MILPRSLHATSGALSLTAVACLVALHFSCPLAQADPHKDHAASAAEASCRKTTDGPYKADYESLKKLGTPDWFRDAKFGVFIHWGPYAVPANGSEWYPRRMYQEYATTPKGVVNKKKKDPVFAHHIENYGPQKQFGYKDFIPQFKAEKWDPEAWVSLFQKAGIRYVVPVAEHHDGFAMYDSSHTTWDSVEMGPKRDVIGELAAACREQDMHFGVSSHFAYNWHYYTHEDRFDTSDPKYASLYGRPHESMSPADQEFLDVWYDRTIEIIDKYEPEVLWFDFGFNFPEFEPARKCLAAYYYNRGQQWNKEVVLQYKRINFEAFPDGAAMLDLERGKLADIRDLPWQTDTSISNKSWGYIEGDTFKPVGSLINDLIDIVSKNGCLLLNVGPRADGTIPQEAQDILLEMGAWLDVNGEAIYDTRPWHVFGEGPTGVAIGDHSEHKNADFTAEDIRFTANGESLYAIGLGWPSDQKSSIKALGTDAKLLKGKIASVRLLGSEAKLQWEQTGEALNITLPESRSSKHAFALKIEMAQD